MSTAIRIMQGSFGRVALLDMDKPLVTHAHHHCHILLKASGADSRFTVRGRMQPLTAASAVLVNAWEPHAYTPLDESLRGTVILALYIDCTWLAGIHRQLAVAGHPHFFSQPCVPITPAIRKRADDLAAEMTCQPDIAPARLEQQLSGLAIAVLDPFSEWRNAGSLVRAGLPRAPDARIRRAMGYLQEHITEGIGMDALASRACLSRAHFFALFRKYTSLSPGVYANALRMEAAIGELGYGDRPMAEISHGLGFSAQSHFTRFFRQHLGITPTDYRRKASVLTAAGS